MWEIQLQCNTSYSYHHLKFFAENISLSLLIKVPRVSLVPKCPSAQLPNCLSKYTLPLFFKYDFKSLAGGSLRYKVFLVSKITLLQCQLLSKLGRPETSTIHDTYIYIITYIYIYIYISSKCHSQVRIPHLRNGDSQETFFSNLS